MAATTERKTAPRSPGPITNHDFVQLRDKVDELYRTIRGYNGNAGMAADVIWLKDAYKKLNELTIPDMKTEIIEAMCQRLELATQPTIKWPELLKGMFLPILTGVITGIVTAMVVQQMLAP